MARVAIALSGLLVATSPSNAVATMCRTTGTVASLACCCAAEVGGEVYLVCCTGIVHQPKVEMASEHPGHRLLLAALPWIETGSVAVPAALRAPETAAAQVTVPAAEPPLRLRI